MLTFPLIEVVQVFPFLNYCTAHNNFVGYRFLLTLNIFLSFFSAKKTVTMLKWTVHKRAGDPSGAHTPFPSTQSANKTCSRRSLGNVSRPIKKRNVLQEHRRISLGSNDTLKSIRFDDKENPRQITMQPYNFRSNIASTPVHGQTKLDFALRDLRNITPKSGAALQQIANTVITPSRKRPLPKTPQTSPNISPIRDVKLKIPCTPYASTLPTFELEYSPCGADVKCIPKDLTGVTVTDNFFNNPRYFKDRLDFVPASKRLKMSSAVETPFQRVTNDKTSKNNCKNSNYGANIRSSIENNTDIPSYSNVIDSTNTAKVNNRNIERSNSRNSNNNSNKNNDNSQSDYKMHAMDETLSSSALDDTALDKMIDAILESARKEKPSFARNLVGRKAQIAFRTSFRRFSSDSPTYTAAEDPASDLSKFSDKFLISPEKILEAGERTIILDEKNLVNEREVKTPEMLESKSIIANSNVSNIDSNCQLKRQRAVRRKHNVKLETQCRDQAGNSQTSAQLESRNEADERDVDMENKPIATPKKTVLNDVKFDSFLKKSIDELAEMITPIADNEKETDVVNFPQCNDITSTTLKLSYESTPIIHATDLKASSTPTGNLASVASIRRCLSYSSSPPHEMTDENSLEKRKSTASSTASSSLTNCSRNGCNIGSVDLAIFSENNKLHIHGELLV